MTPGARQWKLEACGAQAVMLQLRGPCGPAGALLGCEDAQEWCLQDSLPVLCQSSSSSSSWALCSALAVGRVLQSFSTDKSRKPPHPGALLVVGMYHSL